MVGLDRPFTEVQSREVSLYAYVCAYLHSVYTCMHVHITYTMYVHLDSLQRQKKSQKN